MDWRSYIFVLFMGLLPLTHCWSTTINNFADASRLTRMHQRNEVSPYLDLVLCPIRDQPWNCARQQSGRILDVWDSELQTQWQKLKVEADRQLNSTIEKRGYSASEALSKEKPSTILKKIEIGTSFMKEYLAQTMDGFLGREYDYGTGTKSEGNAEYEDQEETETDTDGDVDEDHEDDDDDDDDQTENESEHNEDNDGKINENENEAEDGSNKNTAAAVAAAASAAASTDDASNGVEFIEIEGTAAVSNNNKNGQLKKPGGGGNRNKRKKGNKGQPATVVIVQEESHGHGHDDDGHGHGGGGHGGGNKKQKRKKRKKHQHGAEEAVETIVIEQEPSNHLGIGLLEELAGADDLLSGGGGKRKKKQHPSKYGRSNGATRGKKKKKKKALQKLILLGTFLKAKIELLLKLLGAHLQIKFFAIALIGLLINIARFWIDVKRGGAPQKVVYVEHAHHQHHYEEAGGDDWGEQGGGGYWKRSLQTDPTIEKNGAGASTDSYQLKSQPYDPAAAQYMAYRNQWQ